MNSSSLAAEYAWPVRIALAFLPTLFFLFSLYLLDSFRLVRPRRIAACMLFGLASGVLSFLVNSLIMERVNLPIMTFAVTVAPVVEEIIKCSWMTWLIHTRRAGFLVDAALLGFATGAGFGLSENVYYLKIMPDSPTLVWIIRGFGTALMHGGAVAIFAVLLRGLSSRYGALSSRAWLPALAAAIVVHALFNRFMSHPILATGIMLVVWPLVLKAAYSLGETQLRNWLGRGFDRDTELLALVKSGAVSETPLGRYLLSLRDSFRPADVADMLCLLRLQAELSIRAKGVLLLRENGLEPKPDPETRARLEEVDSLERSLGRTGLMALRPLCRWQNENAWQRHLLEEDA